MFNKILIGILFLLFLTIAVELTYIYSLNKMATINKSSSNAVAIPTVTPAPGPTLRDGVTGQTTLININRLISKNAVTSSFITNEYIGIVTSVADKDVAPPFQNYPNYKPIMAISFQPKNSINYKFPFYFDQKEISRLTVKKMSGKNTEMASYKDLQAGSSVTITEKYNFITNEEPTYEIVIQ